MSIPQRKKQLVVPGSGLVLFALASILLFIIKSALVTSSSYDPWQGGSLRLLETLTLIGFYICVAIIAVRLLSITLFDLALRKFYKPSRIDGLIFSVAAYILSCGLIARYVFPSVNLGALLTTSFVFLFFLLVGIPLYIFVVNKDIGATATRPRLRRLLIAPLILTFIFVVISFVLSRTILNAVGHSTLLVTFLWVGRLAKRSPV
jgi:hypothetical protein